MALLIVIRLEDPWFRWSNVNILAAFLQVHDYYGAESKTLLHKPVGCSNMFGFLCVQIALIHLDVFSWSFWGNQFNLRVWIVTKTKVKFGLSPWWFLLRHFDNFMGNFPFFLIGYVVPVREIKSLWKLALITVAKSLADELHHLSSSVCCLQNPFQLWRDKTRRCFCWTPAVQSSPWAYGWGRYRKSSVRY